VGVAGRRRAHAGVPRLPQNVEIGTKASFKVSPLNGSVLLAAIASLVTSCSFAAAARSCTLGASASHCVIFGSKVPNAAKNAASSLVLVASSMSDSKAQNAVGLPVATGVVSSGTVTACPGVVEPLGAAPVAVVPGPGAGGAAAVDVLVGVFAEATVDPLPTDELTIAGVVLAGAAIVVVAPASTAKPREVDVDPPVAIDDVTMPSVVAVTEPVDVEVVGESGVGESCVGAEVGPAVNVFWSLLHAPSAVSAINGATRAQRRISCTSELLAS
jgi:hypothetical protein